MSRYFFSAEAKQDLKRIVNRIAHDNPTAARKLAAEIMYSNFLFGLFPSFDTVQFLKVSGVGFVFRLLVRC